MVLYEACPIHPRREKITSPGTSRPPVMSVKQKKMVEYREKSWRIITHQPGNNATGDTARNSTGIGALPGGGFILIVYLEDIASQP
jgi:hypothetical protein